MADALVLTTILGALLGAVHAGYVYVQRLEEPCDDLSAGRWALHLRAGYFALWTLLLWLVLGSYVVALWALSLPLYAARGLVRRLRERRSRAQAC